VNSVLKGAKAGLTVATSTGNGGGEGEGTGGYFDEEGERLRLAILVAFMVGVIQVFCGIARLGRFGNHLPGSVMTGFTSGAALIIMTSQLKDGLGLLKIPRGLGFFENVYEVIWALGSFMWLPLIFSSSTIILVIVRRNFLAFFLSLFLSSFFCPG